ncbi:hypothetical protein Nepgr_014910 [Nepenthes gracilis]|uniref:R3H domain-containing protein n=1 Tax=Nepenthes gracilis TaxID=150966 RepID=A0AAD3SM02_NEPGR|nr:hypothetical protein Nepgr_014910 [Nepenthes gracilis]
MSVTQFAMVEELASLVKDNLPCKYLVLSVEEALVNYLKEGASQDGILELEPMSSYNRLLLHRLADIFGFAHESFGEGDDRHLVLERCPETSIPSILVSDILWQHDAYQSPTTPPQLCRRDDASSVLKIKIPSPPRTLEEREKAYLAARERIFSRDGDLKEDVRQKQRYVPVVARRMIAHALGKRINAGTQIPISNTKGHDQQTDTGDCQEKSQIGSYLFSGVSVETMNCSDDENVICAETERNGPGCNALTPPGKEDRENLNRRSPSDGAKSSRRDGLASYRGSMEVENLGAAKRMFAQALGMHDARAGLPRSSLAKGVLD